MSNETPKQDNAAKNAAKNVDEKAAAPDSQVNTVTASSVAEVSTTTASDSASPTSTSAPSPKSQTSPPATAVFRFAWLGWLNLLLIIGLGAGLFYVWFSDQQQQTLVEQQGQELQAELTGNKQQLIKGQEELQQLRQQLDANSGLQSEQQALHSRLQLQLDGLDQRINGLVSTDRQDWQLAEAEYLLRLANQRLLMEHNPASALGLMESADEIVKGVADTELFAVRDALARDLVALKLTPVIDQSGLYLELGALADQVGQLAFVALTPKANEMQSPTAETTQQQNWKAVIIASFKRLLATFNDQISIQTHEKPLLPVLGPEQQAYVRENIQLLFAQAQLAVLRENPAIYQDALQRVNQLLEDNYSLNEQRGLLMAEVARLAELSILQTLPDISASYKALSVFNDRRHQRKSRAEKNAPAVQENTPEGDATL